MKRLTLLIAAFFLLIFFRPAVYAQLGNGLINKLSRKEIKGGWQLLWDGKTTAGWRSYNNQDFPASDWEINDGILSVVPPKDKNITGIDIITIKTYKNFELSVDFNYTPGANSGIKYFIDGTTNIGCEYQVLDDKLHPDAKAGINGNRTLAGLYDLIPPKSKKDLGANHWQTAKIIVKGNHVEHWLNGQLVVSYERGDASWKTLVATSKFKPNANFGEAAEGHILLQDHGDKVSFRNIKLREIR